MEGAGGRQGRGLGGGWKALGKGGHALARRRVEGTGHALARRRVEGTGGRWSSS